MFQFLGTITISLTKVFKNILHHCFPPDGVRIPEHNTSVLQLHHAVKVETDNFIFPQTFSAYCDNNNISIYRRKQKSTEMICRYIGDDETITPRDALLYSEVKLFKMNYSQIMIFPVPFGYANEPSLSLSTKRKS